MNGTRKAPTAEVVDNAVENTLGSEYFDELVNAILEVAPRGTSAAGKSTTRTTRTKITGRSLWFREEGALHTPPLSESHFRNLSKEEQLRWNNQAEEANARAKESEKGSKTTRSRATGDKKATADRVVTTPNAAYTAYVAAAFRQAIENGSALPQVISSAIIAVANNGTTGTRESDERFANFKADGLTGYGTDGKAREDYKPSAGVTSKLMTAAVAARETWALVNQKDAERPIANFFRVLIGSLGRIPRSKVSEVVAATCPADILNNDFGSKKATTAESKIPTAEALASKYPEYAGKPEKEKPDTWEALPLQAKRNFLRGALGVSASEAKDWTKKECDEKYPTCGRSYGAEAHSDGGRGEEEGEEEEEEEEEAPPAAPPVKGRSFAKAAPAAASPTDRELQAKLSALPRTSLMERWGTGLGLNKASSKDLLVKAIIEANAAGNVDLSDL